MKFVLYRCIPSSLRSIFRPCKKLLHWHWRQFLLFVGQSCVSFHLLAWSRSKSYSWKRRAKWKGTSSGFFPRSAWLRHAHWKSSSSTVSLKVAWSPFLDLRLKEVGMKCFRANHHWSITCVTPVLLKLVVLIVWLFTYIIPPTPHPTSRRRLICVSVPENVIIPPHPTQRHPDVFYVWMCLGTKKKREKRQKCVSCSWNGRKLQKTRSRCDASNVKTQKHAKTVFRHAAFYPRPANYMGPKKEFPAFHKGFRFWGGSI